MFYVFKKDNKYKIVNERDIEDVTLSEPYIIRDTYERCVEFVKQKKKENRRGRLNIRSKARK